MRLTVRGEVRGVKLWCAQLHSVWPGQGFYDELFIKLSMAVFPSETRSFEEKQIFQEEQKTICAIKLIVGFFFQFSPSFIIF